MKALVFVTQKDFKDESLSAIRKSLQKWDVKVDVACTRKGEVYGYHGAACPVDTTLLEVSASDYACIILIDGPGISSLSGEMRQVSETVRNFYSTGKVVCGINNAIRIIAKSNIIKGKEISEPKDNETASIVGLYGGVLTKGKVENDSGIITAGNPDEASEFADVILKAIKAK